MVIICDGDGGVVPVGRLTWIYFILFYAPCYTFLEIRAALPGKTMIQQPQEQRYPVVQMHAVSFCVSVIHQTLTWTTGSLMCVREHLYVCVYTQGLGIPTVSQHNTFGSEKLSQIFCVLLTWPGFELRVFGSRVQRSTNRATPSPLDVSHVQETMAMNTRVTIGKQIPLLKAQYKIHIFYQK